MIENPFNVQPGQRWKDNDPRLGYSRYITIERVEGKYAYCIVAGGYKTRIRLDRFNAKRQTGYTLVEGEA